MKRILVIVAVIFVLSWLFTSTSVLDVFSPGIAGKVREIAGTVFHWFVQGWDALRTALGKLFH